MMGLLRNFVILFLALGLTFSQPTFVLAFEATPENIEADLSDDSFEVDGGEEDKENRLTDLPRISELMFPGSFIEESALAGEPEPAIEENLGAEDMVYDEAELQNWLDSHRETGGTVKLGGDVVLVNFFAFYEDVSVVIDTGPTA